MIFSTFFQPFIFYFLPSFLLSFFFFFFLAKRLDYAFWISNIPIRQNFFSNKNEGHNNEQLKFHKQNASSYLLERKMKKKNSQSENLQFSHFMFKFLRILHYSTV